MKYIIAWIQRILFPSKVKSNQKETPTTEKKETQLSKNGSLVCGVTFDYFTNKTIGIELLMGQQYDTDNVKFAETFAQFIYHVTQPSFRQTILNNIKTSSETPEDTLFYQNVIFNIALLETYKKEQAANSDNEPVIRPLAVFSRA